MTNANLFFSIVGVVSAEIAVLTMFMLHGFSALRAEMHVNFSDVKNQIQHLIDLHINHAERIAALDERTGGTKKREGTNG